MVSGSPDVSNSFVFPYGNSFASQSGWWCPAPRMFPIHLSPLIAFLPVWLVVSGSPDVSNSFVSPYSNSFVSQSGWWCPAHRMFPIHLSPLIAIHLSPSLAGGVRLSGCLQFICLPLRQFICFPVLLVVPGSLHVSNSFVFPYSNSFFSQSGWWCRALGISPIHLSPLIAIHLPPSLAGGVRLSGCLHFICLPLQQVWLVVSGSVHVSNSFISPSSNAFVSHSCW